MTTDIESLRQERLAALRRFREACPPGLRAARLMQFRGADFLGASDVAFDAIEDQVSASVRSGLSVDWIYRSGILYLRASEPGGPVPSWERVFAQEDLADVRALLGAAGGEREP
jgi:hypothetical protein